MIQEALLRSILSGQQLEDAILSYNQIYAQRWNFAALHYFFSEAYCTIYDMITNYVICSNKFLILISSNSNVACRFWILRRLLSSLKR